MTLSEQTRAEIVFILEDVLFYLVGFYLVYSSRRRIKYIINSWNLRRMFLRLMAIGAIARGIVITVSLNEHVPLIQSQNDGTHREWKFIFVSTLPTLFVLSGLSALITFFAELYFSILADKKIYIRKVVLLYNLALYVSWISALVVAVSLDAYEQVSKVLLCYIGVMFYVAALGLLYYAIRLYLQLQQLRTLDNYEEEVAQFERFDRHKLYRSTFLLSGFFFIVSGLRGTFNILFALGHTRFLGTGNLSRVLFYSLQLALLELVPLIVLAIINFNRKSRKPIITVERNPIVMASIESSILSGQQSGFLAPEVLHDK